VTRTSINVIFSKSITEERKEQFKGKYPDGKL
jgi:hypothetical protein